MQYSKYLVANARDLQWGLTVSTVGFDDICPHEAYPSKGHADGYYFDPEEGRELWEYQLQYVVEGGGSFASGQQQATELRAGDIFLLFPGEWHTYRPDPETGWKCYWIGFKGHNMDDRVRAGFLSPAHPIYHVGYSAEMVGLFEHARRCAADEEPYYQQILAGTVNMLIGLMYSMERTISLNRNQQHIDLISKARLRIRESLEQPLTIQQLAEDLGMSYSNFRKLFKLYSGVSPSTYQQDLRIQRAKELLSTTDKSVKEIAYQLNFDSPDYFSSKFRQRVGHKPSEMRQGR